MGSYLVPRAMKIVENQVRLLPQRAIVQLLKYKGLKLLDELEEMVTEPIVSQKREPLLISTENKTPTGGKLHRRSRSTRKVPLLGLRESTDLKADAIFLSKLNRISDHDLTKAKSLSLSDKQVLKLVKKKAKVVLYSDLHKYKSIEQLLEPYGAVFLLYQNTKNTGHWVCVFKRKSKSGKTIVECFDPYGQKGIDTELNWLPMSERKKLGTDIAYLSQLLHDAPSKWQIEYNNHPFQKYGNNIATCGRWASLRLMCRDLSLSEFKKMFNPKNKHSDDIATLLTLLEINV